jgi:hypothetical protein
MEIKILNFKGLKNRTLIPPYQIAEGAGWGKTRCFEAFMWLVGNYNPTRVADLFDDRNDDINDTVEVFADFDEFTLRKKVAKNLKTGEPGTVNYFVNEEAVTASDFKKFTTLKNLQFCNLRFFDEIEKSTDKFALLFPVAKSKIGEKFKEFDINEAMELKSKKITLRNKLSNQIKANESKVNMICEEPPVIPDELKSKELEYQALKCNLNAPEIERLNREYNNKIYDKNKEISIKSSQINQCEEELRAAQIKLKAYEEVEFTEEEVDLNAFTENFNKLKNRLEKFTLYDNIEDLRSHISNNLVNYPDIYSNSLRISEIKNTQFNAGYIENSGFCEIINNVCELAKEKGNEIALMNFEKNKKDEIALLKSHNSVIINAIFDENRIEFDLLKNKLLEAENELKAAEIRISEREERKRDFYFKKNNNIELLKSEINKMEMQIESMKSDLNLLSIESSKIAPPSLPEIIEMNEELESKHIEFVNISKEINKIEGANERIRKEVNFAKEENKNFYIQITELTKEINILSNEIKDYLAEIQRCMTISTENGNIEFRLFRETDGGTYVNEFEVLCDGKKLSNSQNVIASMHISMMLQKFHKSEIIVMLDNAECCNPSFEEAKKIGLKFIEFNHVKNFTKKTNQ